MWGGLDTGGGGMSGSSSSSASSSNTIKQSIGNISFGVRNKRTDPMLMYVIGGGLFFISLVMLITMRPKRRRR